MARSTVPSFVRDSDQAAELAALLRDDADRMQYEYDQDRGGMGRSSQTRAEQAIARVRRWADELVPEQADAEPVRPPLQIRPAANDG